jgi:hypothetical protein
VGYHFGLDDSDKDCGSLADHSTPKFPNLGHAEKMLVSPTTSKTRGSAWWEGGNGEFVECVFHLVSVLRVALERDLKMKLEIASFQPAHNGVSPCFLIVLLPCTLHHAVEWLIRCLLCMVGDSFPASPFTFTVYAENDAITNSFYLCSGMKRH